MRVLSKEYRIRIQLNFIFYFLWENKKWEIKNIKLKNKSERNLVKFQALIWRRRRRSRECHHNIGSVWGDGYKYLCFKDNDTSSSYCQKPQFKTSTPWRLSRKHSLMPGEKEGKSRNHQATNWNVFLLRDRFFLCFLYIFFMFSRK